MLKTKKSFFERVTGSTSFEPDGRGESSMPIYAEEEETEMIMRAEPQRPVFAEEEENFSSDAEGQLTIDVYQTDTEIVIKSTIAGVKPEDLDVSINNDMVTIKGERKNEEIVSAENYYYQECYWGHFSRSVVLPIDIISDKAEASLKNGILTIRLPKADTTKIKRIQVRGF
ncbi:MAG: Protein containing Heat shock protein Hsp20 protein [Parcubacteria group bacterium GW2011_GWD2_38_11]|nr:MAG: Protein containing Heat shock protein Hsp20 protein [Parcubacteria group bacterium GW2011_GWD2_38_11]